MATWSAREERHDAARQAVPEPFRIHVSEQARRFIRHAEADTLEPWREGRGLGRGREPQLPARLVSYWQSSYDWSAHEAGLNAFAHFTASIGEARLHFVHERGRGARSVPLLLLHGWPDSFHRAGAPFTWATCGIR